MFKNFTKIAFTLLVAFSLTNYPVALGQELLSLEALTLKYVTEFNLNHPEDRDQIDYLAARLKSEEELQHSILRTSLKRLTESMAERDKTQSNRDSVVQESFGGVEIDRKTIQTLIGNAHFELQRLEWETAALAPVKTDASESAEAKILKLQLSGIQNSLQHVDQLVKFAQDSVDQAVRLHKMKTLSNEELQNAKSKLVEQLAEQTKLKNELELLALKIEQTVAAPALEAAQRTMSMKVRRTAIEDQLGRYAAMLKTLSQLESINSKADAIQSRIRKEQENASEYQNEHDKLKVLSQLLTTARESYEQRVKDAEAKKSVSP